MTGLPTLTHGNEIVVSQRTSVPGIPDEQHAISIPIPDEAFGWDGWEGVVLELAAPSVRNQTFTIIAEYRTGKHEILSPVSLSSQAWTSMVCERVAERAFANHTPVRMWITSSDGAFWMGRLALVSGTPPNETLIAHRPRILLHLMFKRQPIRLADSPTIRTNTSAGGVKSAIQPTDSIPTALLFAR